MDGNRLAGLARRAAQVAAVRQRLERWRARRERGGRMPSELWAAAVALAREHGAYRIARALGLNYQTLKDRGGEHSPGDRTGAPGEFVEIPGTALLTGAAPNVVELSDRSGRTLVIRLAGALDVPGLVAAFFRAPT